MIPRIRTSLVICVAAAALLGLLIMPSDTPRAAEFPNGPIKWIIPYPSGGAYDRLSRGLAPILSKKFGVPVVVLIVPGPEGYSQIINAKPDGQTIGMSEPLSVFATALLTKPPYNVDDMIWLGRINASISMLVASKKSGLTSIDQVPKHKGPVRGAAFGVSTPILQQILLADVIKFQVAPVNFRTIGEMFVGTVRGDVDLAVAGTTQWLNHIRAGSVSPLLTWDDERHPDFPNVPSLKDIGQGGLVKFMNHRSVVAPPGLPEAIADKIVKVFQETVATGEGRAFLEKTKFETNQLWGKPFRDQIEDVKQAVRAKEAIIRRLTQ